MELPYGINKRYGSFAAFLLVAVWCWVAFDRPYVFPKHVPWNIYANAPQFSTSDVFDFPPLVSPELQSLCATTNWTSSLIFRCELAEGGVAEVRNSVLSCVRFAVAAGAELVLPMIKVPGDIAHAGAELDHFFDLEHFGKSLVTSCPQLRLRKSLPPGAAPAVVLDLKTIIQNPEAKENFRSQWSEEFFKWLSQTQRSQRVVPTEETPTVVELKGTYLGYPILSDPPLLAQHFGKIMKVRQDARKLATATLMKLREAYGLTVDLTQPILEHAYLGAFLDSRPPSSDASDLDKEYSQFSAQLELYLDQATRMNLTLIYLASAVADDIPKFVREAKSIGIDVATKMDLLRVDSLAALLSMTEEQRLLVDYLILGRGSGFVGIGAGESTGGFVWDVALKRHQFAGRVDDPEEDGDGLSWIFGDDGTHEEFVVGMWS